MDLLNQGTLVEIRSRLQTGMLDYLQEGDAAYTAADVAKCMGFLHTFLLQLGEAKEDTSQAMELMVKLIGELNQLNEAVEHEMIETDQREDLAEMINEAMKLMGHNPQDEDLTEDHRDW